MFPGTPGPTTGGRLAEAGAWHWLRDIHNAADRTLAPSTGSVERLAAHGVQRIWLWGRGVDTRLFSPAARSASLRQALAPDREVLAGYVGRLAPEKQVELLAGMADLPVVAPAVGGPLDLIDDGVTGRLVPPGDADALTAATRRLAADPRARAAMGRAGRQRVVDRSWTALGDELIGHYAAVLGERCPLAGELAGNQGDAVTPGDLLAGRQVGRARLGVVNLR